jgi:hypothetical protein
MFIVKIKNKKILKNKKIKKETLRERKISLLISKKG